MNGHEKPAADIEAPIEEQPVWWHDDEDEEEPTNWLLWIGIGVGAIALTFLLMAVFGVFSSKPDAGGSGADPSPGSNTGGRGRRQEERVKPSPTRHEEQGNQPETSTWTESIRAFPGTVVGKVLIALGVFATGGAFYWFFVRDQPLTGTQLDEYCTTNPEEDCGKLLTEQCTKFQTDGAACAMKMKRHEEQQRQEQERQEQERQEQEQENSGFFSLTSWLWSYVSSTAKVCWDWTYGWMWSWTGGLLWGHASPHVTSATDYVCSVPGGSSACGIVTSGVNMIPGGSDTLSAVAVTSTWYLLFDNEWKWAPEEVQTFAIWPIRLLLWPLVAPARLLYSLGTWCCGSTGNAQAPQHGGGANTRAPKDGRGGKTQAPQPGGGANTRAPKNGRGGKTQDPQQGDDANTPILEKDETVNRQPPNAETAVPRKLPKKKAAAPDTNVGPQEN